MDPWWAQVPPGRVTRVLGAAADALDRSLDPLPDSAPATIRFRPPADLPVVTADDVMVLLTELDLIARELFPSWLPGADSLGLATTRKLDLDVAVVPEISARAATVGRSPGARADAARALAATVAATAGGFGPFLADLAGRAVLGEAPGGGARRRFPDEVRAAGLARVIAASYQRDSAAILVLPPTGPGELGTRAVGALVAALEWLAHHGRFAVWLAWPSEVSTTATRSPGPSGHPSLDRLGTIHACLTQAEGATGSATADRSNAKQRALSYPPVTGQPHPASAAEARVERALAGRSWADGRAWNQTHRSGPLAPTIRLDLLWRAERCVVEIDGPEHHSPAHYAADRRRDVDLALDGYVVLRFTNDEVLDDVAMVLSKIERLLHQRRQEKRRQRQETREGT
ncbi:DUF559 domain-containing protein [Pseudofrankia asymbiotica]|uniref:DUF559 domain-containing protein n=1 Tax=Pseudofrankia asymbiotica TaxID=1834516 RepID=A0A1V2I023_9ACTN|nr:DUF559 domain-containing protein [Pseudofrankia asymbiotica]ONH22513.1 hypothetical protein BL253_35400 [Pseudofrankia asymbiotica]